VWVTAATISQVRTYRAFGARGRHPAALLTIGRRDMSF
jgi:hypothetical protein